MNGQAVVLFDGECAYCTGWVRWIMKRDRGHRFRFIPISSDEGRVIRSSFGVARHVDSLVLVRDGQAWTRSDAAWRILSSLPKWGAAAWALRLVPRPLRDLGYDLIARNRHRLGAGDVCELP